VARELRNIRAQVDVEAAAAADADEEGNTIFKQVRRCK